MLPSLSACYHELPHTYLGTTILWLDIPRLCNATQGAEVWATNLVS